MARSGMSSAGYCWVSEEIPESALIRSLITSIVITSGEIFRTVCRQRRQVV